MTNRNILSQARVFCPMCYMHVSHYSDVIIVIVFLRTILVRKNFRVLRPCRCYIKLLILFSP